MTDRRQNEQPATPTEIAVERVLAQISSINLRAEDGQDKWIAALRINFGTEDGCETRQAVLSAVTEEVHRRHNAILKIMLGYSADETRPPMVQYGEDGSVGFYRGSYNNGEYGDEYE